MLVKMVHEKVEKTEAMVEISFPLFRKHSVGDDGWDIDSITRIDYTGETYHNGGPVLREIEVSRHGDYRAGTVKWGLEVTPRGHFDSRSGQDYNYCLSEYAATETEFLGMLGEMEKAIEAAKTGKEVPE